MRRTLAAALTALAFVALSACSMGLSPMGIPLGTITLSSPEQDPGGTIWERAAEITALRVAASQRADLPYERRITGDCFSACTFYLAPDLRPHVCFEPDARLGFHGPNTANGTVSPEQRRVAALTMAEFYPPRIASWFLAPGGPAESDEIVVVSAADLIAAGEARACEA